MLSQAFNMIIIYLSISAGNDGRESMDFPFFRFFHTCVSFPLFTAVVENPRACERGGKSGKLWKVGVRAGRGLGVCFSVGRFLV